MIPRSTSPDSSTRLERGTLLAVGGLALALLLAGAGVLAYAMAGTWRPVAHIGVAAVLFPAAALLVRRALRQHGRTLPAWGAFTLGGLLGTGAALVAGYSLAATPHAPGAATFGIGGALAFHGILTARRTAD